MKVNIHHVKGITMVGKADSGHWVTMDGPEDVGGANAGSRPMELLLIALGGCTGMDVLSILQKMRVDLDDFYGKNIPVESVKRAIELSETKYCSASIMLRNSCEITTEYNIIEK